MRTNKKIFAGMAVLVLLFGFVLAGCASVKTISEETETSRAIFEAASELMASQEGRIKADELVSGLAEKFPGLKTMPLGMSFQENLIQVNYGGTVKWPTNYAIECTMDSETLKITDKGNGISTRVADGNTIVTSIISVIENRAEEVEK